MEPYVAENLPLATDRLDYGRLIRLVGEANAALARYDGLLSGIVNPSILLSPLTTQEAVLSSRIEGTQATLDEVLEHEAGAVFDEGKEQDIKEIVNYRKTLMLAKDVVAEQPITLALIRQMHCVLLDSVRGKDKTPGEFRKDQNWIGSPGCKIEEASFVPPSPLRLNDFLENWQGYVQLRDFDPLVQAGIVHAQFELLHPFKDGNGRIGRLLIPLFLFQQKVLSSPMFYLSAYLEEHRDEYYSRLQAISRQSDWNGWIEFFLQAVHAQAHENSERVKTTMALYEEMKIRIADITHSQFSIRLLDAIFDRPIFKTTDFVARTEISKVTAMALIRQLRQAEILVPLIEASGRRPAVLMFPRLLAVADGKSLV